MKTNFLLIFFFLPLTFVCAQKPPESKQPFRCLTLQMTGKTRNIHFHEGSDIILKTFGNRKKQHLTIVQLSDSSFFYFPDENQHSIFDLQEIKFREIKKIYSHGEKQLFALKGIGALGGAGVFLFSFDVLNQLKSPPIVINPTIVAISSGFIGLSFIINKLQHPAYKISKRHYLRLYHIENPKWHTKSTF